MTKQLRDSIFKFPSSSAFKSQTQLKIEITQLKTFFKKLGDVEHTSNKSSRTSFI